MPTQTIALTWDLAIEILGLLDELGGTNCLVDWPSQIGKQGAAPEAGALAQSLQDAMRPSMKVGDRVRAKGSPHLVGTAIGLMLRSGGWDVEVNWDIGESGFRYADDLAVMEPEV